MYQLVKRCYIYGLLIVHVIEAKSILMLLSKITFIYSILNKCYNVHIVQLAIEIMLSLSEMYHGTYTNRNKCNFLCRRLIKMSDRQIKHACILFIKVVHIFLA